MTSAASIVSTWHTSCSTRFTRGRVRELKNAHNSVTVQNRTHVYMNFFDHKNLGNHVLQLCPKVVKHPVYLSMLLTFIMEWKANFQLEFSEGKDVIFFPLKFTNLLKFIHGRSVDRRSRTADLHISWHRSSHLQQHRHRHNLLGVQGGANTPEYFC